jgi:hypothetical protein
VSPLTGILGDTMDSRRRWSAGLDWPHRERRGSRGDSSRRLGMTVLMVLPCAIERRDQRIQLAL